MALTRNALAEPTQFSLDNKNRKRFPASSAYDVLLTVVNPYPDELTVDWDLPTIIGGECFLIPPHTIRSITNVHNYGESEGC